MNGRINLGATASTVLACVGGAAAKFRNSVGLEKDGVVRAATGVVHEGSCAADAGAA